jgi:hypothetical protein
MVCWVDTNRTEGYAYGRWFYVQSGSNQGFVKAELVTNQYPYSPSCDSGGTEQLHAVMASLEVTGGAEMYQTYPTAADKANALNRYGFNDWGKYGDWSGDCVMWTALAWLRGNTTTLMHHGVSAAAIGRTYALNTSTNAPRGAAVFWDDGGMGHVALSLGNGVVATTQGYDNDREITTTKKIAAISATMRYMGWTPAP